MAKYRLGDVAPIQQGIPPMEYPCWLLNLDMVESNTGRILEYVYVQPDEIGSSTVSFDINNVLYSKLRPYLNKVVLPDRAGFATSEMLPLRPDTTIITREYLTYFLRSPHFVGYINDKTSGAKMPRANTSDLKAVEIDCPSLERQNAIIGVFEHLTSIIDLYQRQLLALDTLIKARFVELFGGVNEKVSIGSFCNVFGGYSFKSEDISSKGAIKILQIGNVYLDRINWETTNYLPEEFGNSYSKFLLNEGDIVIALTRPIIQSLGNVKACIVKESDLPCLLNQRVGRIVPKKNIDVSIKFIYGCLMTDDFTRYVESCCIGCSQPNISTKDIESYMIPKAGYEEQIKFVKFKEQIDKSKSVVQKALDEAQLLFDSLMQQYFG